MILGWAGAAKTHTVALALNKPPPGVRVSTPCAGAPIRATKQVHITEGTNYFKEIAELEYLYSMLKSGKEAGSKRLVVSHKEESTGKSGGLINSVDERLMAVLHVVLKG